MFMSDLARSVFVQTNLDFDLKMAFWVEQKLQQMKVNAVVKLINGENLKDINSFEQKVKNFSYAFRSVPLSIKNSLWFYEYFQCLNNTFRWSLWEDIIKFDVKDFSFLEESLLIAFNRNIFSLDYILKIAKEKREENEKKDEMRKNLIETSLEFLKKKKNVRDIESLTIKEWNEVREFI